MIETADRPQRPFLMQGRPRPLSLAEALNHALDRVARPQVYILGRPVPAFQAGGVAGFVLALAWTSVLALQGGLSLSVVAALALAAVGTFLGLAMAVVVFTGEEHLVNYAHQCAVLAVTALLLRLLRQPVLPYLDLVVLGLSLFLACGRIGCLMSGCCHGRPHRWGVCYRQEHAHRGPAPYYLGVRLLPVQALASGWLLIVVAVGSALVLARRPDGAALAWYGVAYGMGRFYLEFLRGDPGRRHRWGFTRAQWTSVLVVLSVACAGLSGTLPFHSGSALATALLLGTMVGVAAHRRSGATAHRFLHPDHVAELAHLVAWADEHAEGEIRAGSTSLGLQLSMGEVASEEGWVRHYALSWPGIEMDGPSVRSLVDAICQLGHASGPRQVVTSSRGVVHVLVHPEGTGE